MSEYEQPTEPAAFKDRTVGLVIYGSVEILLGGLCALMVPMMVFVALIPQPGGPPMGLRMMLPAAGFYAVVAVFFIWIGIGSILARRWARAVMLVCSWMWLIFGVVGMVNMLWIMPHMFDNMPPGQQAPPQMILVMQIVTGGFMGCIYFVLPLVFVLFYRSKHVLATCRYRDPRVRWTDGCPLPVLALVILFAYGAFCLVWLPLYNFVIPCFGVFLDGAAGALVVLGVLLLEVYLVWGMYRRKVAAWWTAVLFVVVGSVSGLLTMAQTDLMELYERMGIPAEQLDMIRQMGMVEKMSAMWWVGIPFAVAFLGYLIYVKRYFGVSEEEGVKLEEG
jgi:hypothetical protein